MSYEDLPETANIFDKEEGCRCASAEVKPDTRLEYWENVLEDQNRLKKKIALKTRRRNEEMLINSLHTHRMLQEHRLLMTYAQVETNFDRWRGNPSFWKVPTALRKQNCEEQTYFAQLTPLERNELPPFEYIRLPDEMKKMLNTKSTREKIHSCISFCRRRLDAINLQEIQPHKPQLEDLMVKGIPLLKDSQTNVIKAPVADTFNESESIDSVFQSEPKDQYFLSLNQQKINAKCRGNISVALFFDSEVRGKLQQTFLNFENLTNWTLRVHFKRIPTVKHLSSRNDFDKFFYNKNIQILEPCEKKDLVFWFRSKTCGNFECALQMIIEPDLWRSALSITVLLKGYGSEKNNFEEYAAIALDLENKMHARVIGEALEDILKRVDKNPEVKIYTYDRATIFEAINSIYDPMIFRPNYLYDKEVVDELEKFYQEVRLENHPENWNYSIKFLRSVAKARYEADKGKQLEDNLKTFTLKVEESKKKRAELQELAKSIWKEDPTNNKEEKTTGALTDQKEKDSKGNSKQANTNSNEDGKAKKETTNAAEREILKEPIREPLPKTVIDDLEEVIAKLKTPCCTIKNELNVRLRLGYSLLSAYIDRMCDEAKELEEIFNIERQEPRIREVEHLESSRIRIEILDPCTAARPSFFEYDFPSTDEPAPSWTTEIPLEEAEKRFNAYQGVTIEEPKVKNDSKSTNKATSKETESKKSAGKSSESNKNEENEDIKKMARPTTAKRKKEVLAELEAIAEMSKQPVYPPDEPCEIPEEVFSHFRNNLYVSFYNYLCNFVDDLVAIFDIQPKPEIPREVLERIHNSQFDTKLDTFDVSVHIIDLKKQISDVLKWEEEEKRAKILNPINFLHKTTPSDVITENSVFDVMKAYYPPSPRTRPRFEGDLFAKVEYSNQNLVDEAVSMTPEEIVTTRIVQTDICGSEAVTFGDLQSDWISEIETVLPLPKIPICDCSENQVDNQQMKMVSSFYDSEGLNSESLPSEKSDVNASC